MKLKLPAGKYVVAVSGGVDSISLLNILSNQDDLILIVAHFNHGIREDSYLDERLVVDTAKNLGYKVEVGSTRLGKGASEAAARAARYSFLELVKDKHQALSIVTAHNQDDMIETAFINILRGTDRKGLSAIINPTIIRPLLPYSKVDIVSYAKKNQLQWREDATNQDEGYLRNYLRRNILPRLGSTEKETLVKNIEKVAIDNTSIDQLIATFSHNVIKEHEIDRSKFGQLPGDLSHELVYYWLRTSNVREINRKMVERVSMTLKTGLPGRVIEIDKKLSLELGTKTALLRPLNKTPAIIFAYGRKTV